MSAFCERLAVGACVAERRVSAKTFVAVADVWAGAAANVGAHMRAQLIVPAPGAGVHHGAVLRAHTHIYVMLLGMGLAFGHKSIG